MGRRDPWSSHLQAAHPQQRVALSWVRLLSNSVVGFTGPMSGCNGVLTTMRAWVVGVGLVINLDSYNLYWCLFARYPRCLPRKFKPAHARFFQGKVDQTQTVDPIFLLLPSAHQGEDPTRMAKRLPTLYRAALQKCVSPQIG